MTIKFRRIKKIKRHKLGTLLADLLRDERLTLQQVLDLPVVFMLGNDPVVPIGEDRQMLESNAAEGELLSFYVSGSGKNKALTIDIDTLES